jgi:hypothetical protein
VFGDGHRSAQIEQVVALSKEEFIIHIPFTT